MTFLARHHVFTLICLITLFGAGLRLYGINRGIPYHFHPDEMLALRGAVMLREAPDIAAQSAKFFIYPTLPKQMLGAATSLYERMRQPLDLAQPKQTAVLMRLGRLISALLAIATIPVVFLIGRRMSNDTAGLIAAALMAGSTANIVNAHFFTSDTPLTFFCALTLLMLVKMSQDGRAASYLFAGFAISGAIACKYTAAFLFLPLAAAHIATFKTVTGSVPPRAYPRLRWFVLGLVPLLIAVVTFVAINPLVLGYWDKFLTDITEGVVQPNFTAGQGAPIWTAQFEDVALRRYWFTNLLPWNFGPAFALWGLAGIVWLCIRRERASLVVATYAVAYYAIASNTTTPYMRYVLPLSPALAVAAAVLSADLLSRASTQWQRRLALAATAAVIVITSAWGLAYINMYRHEDPRIQAARFIEQRIPDGATVLVEPSHNIPPMGSYQHDPQLFTEYVGWGPFTVREDEYHLHTLDVYRTLYDSRLSPDDKRRYIQDRLSKVNYIVMDDTFEEFYQHLHDPEHAPVREYYRDLFAGRLGFRLLRSFKTTPSLFGVKIHDDAAEMTFSLFDHPEVFVFQRVPGR